MNAITEPHPVPAIEQAPPEAPQRRGTAAVERLGTAYVLFESGRQAARFAANRRAGTPVAPVFVLLPVARGLAAVRLLLGHPKRLERVLLEALIAGVGVAIPACPGLGETPLTESSVLPA